MVDKFGGLRRKYRRPPRPPGKDAVNLLNCYPFSVLRMFRENEECTFYFNTAEDGILYDKDQKPIGLKDRFGEFRDEVTNAICLQNFLKPVKLKGRYYGIPLKNSLYKLSGMIAGIIPRSIMMVAFTFKVSAPLSNEDDYIFTDPYGCRGVTISKKSLNILGSKHRLDLDYYAKERSHQRSYLPNGFLLIDPVIFCDTMGSLLLVNIVANCDLCTNMQYNVM